MDLALPDLDGLAATRQLLRQAPYSHVIVVSMYEDDAALSRALEAGAHGYVPKEAPPGHLIAVIPLVVTGGLAVSPQLAPSVPASSPAVPSVEPLLKTTSPNSARGNDRS